ncbi:MAG: hypothetical protein ACD_45C00088G0003 [uncultured bacterium]|nr:MAG: hypothetical protein ACD_45C00088G0003 [uncultured bacterium]
MALKAKNIDINEAVSVHIGPHIASHMTAAMFDTFSSGRPNRHRISVFESANSIVKQLNQLMPDVLLCYPSTMMRLLQTDLQKQLHINPKIIVLNSETLSLSLRQRVKDQWPDAIVLNLLGSTEGGVMAINCIQQHKLHVNEDLLIIEPHKTGMYLTNLFNYTFPLIRYEMQDQIHLFDQPCACGSSYQVIEEPQGREAAIFIYNDQTHILYVVIGGVLDRLASLSGYHVWQTKNGIELGVLEKECMDVNKIIKALEHSLADAGLHQPLVTVKFLTELNRGRTGKLITFIPLKSETL